MIAAMLATLLLAAQADPKDVPEETQWKVHSLPLLTSQPPDGCISIPVEKGMVIVLERRDIDEMVKPLPSDWTTEEERMRLVRFSQAQEILDAASDRKDALGCVVSREIGFGAFAMIELIHAGKGRVWKAAANHFLPSVDVIGYEGMDCVWPGPDYQLVEPEGETFFRQVLCSVCTI